MGGSGTGVDARVNRTRHRRCKGSGGGARGDQQTYESTIHATATAGGGPGGGSGRKSPPHALPPPLAATAATPTAAGGTSAAAVHRLCP